MNQEESIASAVEAFEQKRYEFQIFMDGVSQWFATHPKLRQAEFPTVHSVKARLKNCENLKEKLRRKRTENVEIAGDNIFEQITDLAGVRVLHLYQDQFKTIHKEVLVKVEEQHDWYLPETPRAYTWDPESKQFFEGQNIQVEIKGLCTRIRKSMQLAWVSESRGFGVLRLGLRPWAVGMATSSEAMVTEPRPSGGPLSWGGYPEERCEADVRL